ncbi:MAG: SDR family oxidoreductase, partial [Alphaproteobacteria bacterium]|nr:SDR family oxidoreductase [Alphaproteobacteria bacterium]
MERLKGKICVITGTTSGIGRKSAEIFHAEGATVIMGARREAEGRALEKALGARAHFLKTDVTVEADVQRLIGFAVEKYGRLDVLFNNAGGPAPTGGIEGVPVDRFRAALDVLLTSVMLGMKHAAPVMIRQKSGSIINNGSVAGTRAGLSSSMTYSAAKAAVIHLTKCVAMQLGEQNVRV